jgi:2-polyprenyl-3-methyl-5-hydroxy-6-metoxy-1,4-benzoquinol methylase
VTANDVIAAWDKADPTAIHPLRQVSEDAYWTSGKNQADLLSTVLPAGCKVVDFGCGDGRVAVPLRALGYDVTGADGSANMLAALVANDPSMPTVTSDGTDLYEQLGRKVDAVVSLAVLIHHDYTSAEAIIAGLRAAVKVNGLLVLDWPTSDQPSETISWTGVTTWAADEQAAACKRVGLKPLDAGLPWGVYRAVKAG